MTGFSAKKGKSLQHEFEKFACLLQKCRGVRRMGSAALDLAYVSAGRFDGSIQRNVNLWDIAAGTVLIREAGGIVDKFELDKFNKINIKASNERINKDLSKKISIF